MKPKPPLEIRKKVDHLLATHEITMPPVDVDGLATALGIMVSRTPTNDDVSGFIYKQKDNPTVIGVNSNHHPNRQRFTVAHELGHFFLHDKTEVHVDQFVVRLRNTASATGEDRDEIEANRFAAELLMPVRMVSEEISRLQIHDFSDDRAMTQLAKQFQVSVQAMSHRLTGLGYIQSTG